MDGADQADQLAAVQEALGHRYRVIRELGRGGMAVVYLADDLTLGRPVAVKVLKPDLRAAIGPERFLREIQITARLAHPNILPLLESGQSGPLLYYVMPYTEGETLRDRLAREHQLPIPEAVHIAREVADALHHAHGHGIVHRDVKPANVILADGHAVVSDFGIAHACTEAGGDTLTASGVAIGTPGYMSPEQAGGRTDLDGRSDVYALGCVLYEMLAGEMPYTGPSAQAIIAKQLNLPVPLITYARETVPESLVGVLDRALAKSPADRFQTAADFGHALDAAAADARTGPRRTRRGWRWRRWRVGVAAAALVGLAWLGSATLLPERDVAATLDTTVYALLPFTYAPGDVRPLDEVQRLHDAFTRWRGLTVADPLVVTGLVRERRISVDLAASVTRRLGAGRYVRGTVSPVGDSLRVQATLYDVTRGGGALATHVVRLGRAPGGEDAAFAELANRLLLRGADPGPDSPDGGTASLPARQAFNRAWDALRGWDLPAADTAFALAVTFDPRFARAQLWLAVTRSWGGAVPASWNAAAEQAALHREDLSPFDAALSDVVVNEARGRYEVACPGWRAMTRTWPDEFAAWYGLARCDVSDGAVERSAASPSGFRFRTSYHEALLAFRRAFQLHPAILASYGSRSFEVLRAQFLAAGNARRGGVGPPPGSEVYVADPGWVGDTLALVPVPRQPALTVSGAVVQQARRQLRVMLHEVILAWVAAAPSNASAVEALASSLATLGDASALDTLRRARGLAETPTERFRMATMEVWMQVAFALPWSEPGLLRARSLADSLLDGADTPGVDRALLAGLAALTGRAALAARIARAPDAVSAVGAPPVLREVALPLLIFAALGGPADSIAVLERRTWETIEQAIPPAQRARLRLQILARAATLAFPTHRMRAVESLRDGGDYLLDLQAAWAAGDTGAVVRGIEAVRAIRDRLEPADLTLDALWPEAALLVEVGAVRSAAEWLDPTLANLFRTAPQLLAEPVRAGSLVRAAALRSRIAERLGDAEGARRWRRAVQILWSDADASLRPTAP